MNHESWIMNHVLTKNNFTFLDKLYLQVHGTAMGTRMAPSMACLFMGKLEERMLASAPCRPWIWWRYIDDIFFIWTSDEESLTRFIDHMNSFHRTIKFTSEYSTTETHFLDVVIRKEENNGLTTDLFVKPTDKHQYLHSTSCHPRHCKTSIAYSQALRLRRICSNDSDFLRHSQVLKTHLVSRGHSSRAVHQAIKKVKSMPRLSVLSEKPTNRDCANKKIPLVVTYHPSLPPYVRLPVLTTISSTPQIASNVLSLRSPWLLSDALLTWGTSLSELRSRPLMTVPIPPIQHGMFRRTSRCVTCQEHILESDSFKSHTTGAHHKIRGHITCTTSNIIYLISCWICGIQYIGETKKRHLRNVSMVTDPQLKPKSLTLLWANTSIYLITPFLTWSCRALRHLLTAVNRSVSAEKRCGSSVSTPFTPMVSTFRKGMTNFPLFFFSSFFLSPQKLFTFILHLFLHLFYICFVC